MTGLWQTFIRAAERIEGSLPPRARPLLGALAVAALALVAVWPLFGGGMIVTGDNLHAVRIYEMGRCLRDGQLPCRWVPDLGNGYGYPLFNYYPPLPYYIGDLLHRAGLSYLRAVDALYVIGLAGAGLSMFVFARRLWGELGGVVSATAYVYAPYLALDCYMRGALAELWALALVPALLWAVYELVTSSDARWTPAVALFTGLLLLSHNLVALIAAPLVALWAMALLGMQRRAAVRPALLGASGLAWGIGLAAFFTLPVLLEGDKVQLDSLTSGFFDYRLHFASVSDLFLQRSSDYGFLLGQGTETPVQIGWFHWALAALALPAAVSLWRSGQRAAVGAVAVLSMSFAIGTFMAISASRGIWGAFGPLAYLQFPWRYLGLVSLAAAGLAGAWLAALRRRPIALRLALAAVLLGLLIGSGRTFFHSELRLDVSDNDVLHSERFAYLKSGSIHDYLPKAVQEAPEPRAARAEIVDGQGEVLSARSGSDWLTLEIDAAQPARVEASLFDFPDWRVRVDGEAVPHSASVPNGLVTFSLPGGRHEVQINLHSTGAREAGNLISLLSWLALVLAAPALLLAPKIRAWRRLRTSG